MYKVLLVEDQKLVRSFIIDYFLGKEIEVIEAANGLEALQLFNKSFDLVLLDIMMPGIDGYQVCKDIRKIATTPIIFISALSEDENQLTAYKFGADDYITKPFKASLLYAKSLALIKRDKKDYQTILTYYQMKINVDNYQVNIDGNSITLTNKEFKLLLYLHKHQGKVLSREALLNNVWGYDYFGDGRVVDTYIKKLRKKLENYGAYIKTVVKAGYILEKENGDNNEKI